MIGSSSPPAFPLELNNVGFIIKTEFSTRERLLAQLNVLEKAHIGGTIVLVGDYSTTSGGLFSNDSLEIPVHDVLATMVDSESLSSRPDAPRLQYYSNLTATISSCNRELARTIGETYGCELDIMKASYTHYFWGFHPSVPHSYFHLLLYLMDSPDREVAYFRSSTWV